MLDDFFARSVQIVNAGVLYYFHRQHPSDEELAKIERVTPDVSGFSESFAQANNELMMGYKLIRNEF